VNLEYVLGDIQTDCGNLHVDGSLMWFVATITLRRFVAGSGRRPPHQLRTHALQQKSHHSITVGTREQHGRRRNSEQNDTNRGNPHKAISIRMYDV
jgi:hypothetical protein